MLLAYIEILFESFLFLLMCILVLTLPFVILIAVITYRARKRTEKMIGKMDEAAKHLIDKK